MKIIFGYTGFVGSNLCRYLKFDKFYNSKNFNDAIGVECDELYFCGMPAEKWKSNKFPDNDNKILNDIINVLSTIKTNKFILISTIDVYENICSKFNEDYEPDFFINHTYGKNRYLLELFVRRNFINYYIFRLPALIGLGLKKNIIYDLMNNNNISNISIKSSFQWYFLDWLYYDIIENIKLERRIVNLIPEPLETIQIVSLFEYDLSNFKDNIIEYNLKTKYNEKGYIKTKYDSLNAIKSFINFERLNRKNLRVSNICCNEIKLEQLIAILKCFRINEIQIAPTKITNGLWDMTIFDKLNLEGIKLSSLQSITYGLTYNIFDEDTNKLLIHLKILILNCYKYNIKGVVFGCPKTRQIPENGDISKFINFFRELGDLIKETGVIIYIEPNSKKYVNFLNHIEDTAEIVLTINHPNIKLMLDIGHLEQDELYLIEKYKDIIYNIDISIEGMLPLNRLTDENKYSNFIEYLKLINYNEKINLEMLTESVNELNDINESLFKFIRILN